MSTAAVCSHMDVFAATDAVSLVEGYHIFFLKAITSLKEPEFKDI